MASGVHTEHINIDGNPIYWVEDNLQGIPVVDRHSSHIADGTVYSIYPGRYNFLYRGGITTAESITVDPPILEMGPREKKNYYISDIWTHINRVLGNNYYNMVVYNEFSPNHSISVDETNVTQLQGDTITIMNVGKTFNVQIEPIGDGDTTQILLNTGAFLIIYNSKDILSKYRYRICANLDDRLKALTFVLAYGADQQMIHNSALSSACSPAVHPVEQSPDRRGPLLQRIVISPGEEELSDEETLYHQRPSIAERLQNLSAEAPDDERPLTPYERCKVIQIRAENLADNSPPFIDPGEVTNAAEIARMELTAAARDPRLRKKFEYLKIVRVDINNNEYEVPLSQLLSSWHS